MLSISQSRTFIVLRVFIELIICERISSDSKFEFLSFSSISNLLRESFIPKRFSFTFIRAKSAKLESPLTTFLEPFKKPLVFSDTYEATLLPLFTTLDISYLALLRILVSVSSFILSTLPACSA